MALRSVAPIYHSSPPRRESKTLCIYLESHAIRKEPAAQHSDHTHRVSASQVGTTHKGFKPPLERETIRPGCAQASSTWLEAGTNAPPSPRSSNNRQRPVASVEWRPFQSLALRGMKQPTGHADFRQSQAVRDWAAFNAHWSASTPRSIWMLDLIFETR